MAPKSFLRDVGCLALLGCASAAPLDKVKRAVSTTLEVSIAPNRIDDLFYTVDVDFDGQTLPLMIDTGSGDIMVVSSECNNTDPASGCYGVTDRYVIDEKTNIVANESFFSTLGLGSVYGNQSIIPTSFGDITVPELATGLLYSASKGEFQNGSFSGIWGLSMRNVSRQYYFNERLPPVDAMIAEGLLEQPLFSLSLPRIADPASPPTGNLTLGAIEEKYRSMNITYSDIIYTQNYNYDGFPLSPQGWTTQLEAVRMNGVQLNLSVGSLDADGRYISLIDSGAQLLYFRPLDFEALIPLFNGPTILDVGAGNALYYECSRPQLLELKYNGQWFPIDPLDLVIPGDHGTENGTEYCRAPLGTWSRTFGDSIIGVPFLRSAFSVYDYKTPDLYTVKPQLGLASTVDAEAALSRYPDLYEARMGGGASQPRQARKFAVPLTDRIEQ